MLGTRLQFFLTLQCHGNYYRMIQDVFKIYIFTNQRRSQWGKAWRRFFKGTSNYDNALHEFHIELDTSMNILFERSAIYIIYDYCKIVVWSERNATEYYSLSMCPGVVWWGIISLFLSGRVMIIMQANGSMSRFKRLSDVEMMLSTFHAPWSVPGCPSSRSAPGGR